MTTQPKIAIIGNGNVGSAIQMGATKAGYQVRTTGKDPKDVHAAGAWGDIIILAVPFGARHDAIKTLGDLSGKTLVDVTNALNEDYSYAGSVTKSGAEDLQELVKGAKVVKAFNTIFAENMSTGTASGETLTLHVASDDQASKRHVMELGSGIGFNIVDAGPLANARWLEALGYLNIQLGYTQKLGTSIGFRVAGAPSAIVSQKART